MLLRLAALGFGIVLPPATAGSAWASPATALQDESSDEDTAPGPPWLELPDDPLGRLWASVGEDTEPWTLPHDRDPGPVGVWPRWADALQGLHGDADDRRASFAELARIARRDGRADDAFAWVQAFGPSDPEALAGAIPRLFPGILDEVALGAGGVPAPMPDGVLLRPRIPPAGAPIPGRIVPRRATCRGLVVGDATFELLMKVDGSGVVCELTHVAGGAGQVRLQLPAPAGYRLRSLYLDWEQQTPPDGADPETFDWSGVPVTVPLLPRAPGEEDPGYAESFSVFARLDRRETALPRTPGADSGLPDAAVEFGLELVVPPGSDASEEEAEPWEAIAAAWGRAAGIPTTILTAGPAAPRADPRVARRGLRGITIRFHEARDPVALRRRITSAIEARHRASR